MGVVIGSGLNGAGLPDGSPLPVNISSVQAGDRNAGSTTDGYKVVRQECNLTVLSQTTALTIGGGVAGDTHLMGVTVLAPLTGTLVVTGFADGAGTAQSFTFPAATAAGFKDFLGSINSAGPLTVTASNAADDNLILIHWKPV